MALSIRFRLLAAIALALAMTVGALVSAPSSDAARKGASVGKAKWAKSKVDVTTSVQEVKLRVRIKDKSLTRTAYATAESSRGYRTLYLSLARGDNRNGTWEATSYFGASDVGKWRITSIVTVDYDGYRYEKRGKSLGNTLRVKAGPKSRLVLTVPKKAAAGDKVKIQAKLTRRQRAIKKARVYIYVYNEDTGKSRTYKRKTNRKGRVALTITMPASQVYISAGYNGRARYAQSSWAGRTVQRSWAKAILKFTSFPTAVAQTDGAPKTVEVELRDAKTKKVLKGQAVRFNWWRDEVDVYRTVKTNSKGRAAVSFTVPRGGIRVAAHFSSLRYDYVSVAKDITRP